MLDTQKINEHLLFQPQPRDNPNVAILLGARGVSGDIARQAAKDCLSGKFNKIVLCGGATVFQPYVYGIMWKNRQSLHLFDFLTRQKEADYMRRVLINEGVDEDMIVFDENKSTNTGQNFENIQDHVMSEGYKTAALYTVAYHQRRAVETCKKWMPDLKVSSVPVYPYGLSRDTWLDKWSKTLGINGIVRGEFNKTNLENPQSYHYKQADGSGPHCISMTIPTLQ